MTISWEGKPVPYATRWTGETTTTRPVRAGGRLTYPDERPADRAHGLLWARILNTPGQGTPAYGSLHSARQRQCMDLALCHLCGQRAHTLDGRICWLIPRIDADHIAATGRAWTCTPPTCRPCTPIALAHCPALATQSRTVTVAHARPVAALGDLHTQDVQTHVTVPLYDEITLAYLLGQLLIVALNDVRHAPTPNPRPPLPTPPAAASSAPGPLPRPALPPGAPP